jgi:hypothetical protein
MLKSITARRTSLTLILVLAGLMYLSTLIPQTLDSTPGEMESWRRGHNGLLWLIDSLHLHRIYAQPWFVALILCAVLALGLSSVDQLKLARIRLTATTISGSDELATNILKPQLRALASSWRYRPLHSTDEQIMKYIRHPWGYFGNFLLHVGMVVVVGTSLFVALTSRQGVLILVEGEQREASQPWNAAEHGLLASPLRLPGSIRLDRVRVIFNDKQQPAEVYSDLSFTDGAGRSETVTASINRIVSYHGLRLYHGTQYGDAFMVSFTDNNGVTHSEKISVQQPIELTKAGYSDDFSVSWSPYLLSAKYFADAERKSMSSVNPELVLRFTEGGKEIARTTLRPGGSGRLGDFLVHLLRVEKWSKLIIVDIYGISVIFAGFGIIILGALLLYMTPPRELVALRQEDGTYRVYWKAPSFRDFYLEERDALASSLGKENTA